MAKKKKRARATPPAKQADATPRAAEAPAVAAPADEPVFWFGFEVSWAKLALGRVVVFALLAADALMQIRHAPRYGAGGFNVAHLPGLDALGPSRGSYGTAELVNAYLFVLIACGIATRWLVPIAAAIYAWLYFGSQLDSYQHHYLVAMILVLASFVPWQRPRDATPETPVRTWALRLILVELAIMYLWAAISKMDAAWVNGTTLGGQVHGALRSLIDATVGIRVASVMVIAMELALAATVWLKPAWRIAAPLGLVLHLGIIASDLEIGLFAWLMIGFYTFVVPDRVWLALAATPPVRAARRGWQSVAGRFEGGARWIAAALALAAGIALVVACRFEDAVRVGVIATIAVVLAAAALGAWSTRRRAVAWLAAGHVLALATWFAIDRASSLAFDYYKFWSGNARRFKDPDAAEHAYRRLVAIAPDDANAHYQLGRVLLDRATDEGLAELHEAQRLDHGHARAFVQEARWLASHGRMPDAIGKAREAVAADPADAEARRLLSMLEAGRPPTPPTDHD